MGHVCRNAFGEMWLQSVINELLFTSLPDYSNITTPHQQKGGDRFGITILRNNDEYHCIRESVLPLPNRVAAILSGVLK